MFTALLEKMHFPEVKAGQEKEMARLFHGRGFNYPEYQHINIDWLSPVVLVILYKEESDQWLADLSQCLLSELTSKGFAVKSIQVQFRCRELAPTFVLYGEEITDFSADENALTYKISLGTNQNYGIFLDMKNGRSWVREHGQNKRVLNLFSYTCAFSVAALAGGAEKVVNLDMSKAALAVGRDNHRLNEHDLSKVKYLGHDLFKSWGKVKRLGPYDIVIADPPSLQKGSVNIKRDYPKIMRRLPELLTEGGQALLCLNSPDLGFQFIYDSLAEHCPEAKVIKVITPPAEYTNIDPDKGLKCVLVQL
ncbi:class I SAM-dependent methyltransferase [Psychromonas aquatilis]|uniref:Class I SAM-dependent methyltransferase n=1 Tax=Psychromonas aquatilis TaxID=2005072 RepID=A0ABU9GKZ4_9GAMM